jgi:hypothetical protein
MTRGLHGNFKSYGMITWLPEYLNVQNEGWWALGDDFRTLPMSRILADIPHFSDVRLA